MPRRPGPESVPSRREPHADGRGRRRRSPLAFFLAVYLVHGPQAPDEVQGDARTYLAAYETPREFIDAPYSYRILTPVAAQAVSDDPSRGFLITTLVGLVVATVLVFELVAGIAGRGSAAVAAALFAVSPVATICLKNHYLADPLALAFMAAAVLGAVRGQWALVCVAVVFATLARENALVVVLGIVPPLLISRRWQLAATVAGLGAATYLIVHHTSAWFGEVPSETYFTWDRMYGNLTGPQRLTVHVPQILLVALGPVAVAAYLGARRAPASLRWMALLIVPVLAFNLIAADSLRLTSYAFVVTAPLAGLLPWRPLPACAFVGSVWLLGDAVQLLDRSVALAAAELLVAGGALAALMWQLRSERADRRPRTSSVVPA